MLLREPQPRAIPLTGKQIAVVYGIVELGNQPDTFGEPGATRYDQPIGAFCLIPNDPIVDDFRSSPFVSIRATAHRP